MISFKEKVRIFKKKKDREIPKGYLELAAYYHWQARGCPMGDPLTYWLAAERECGSRLIPPKKKWWQTRQDTVPFLARVFEQY